jgi:ABC-type glycerol-3-phosphate transport system substrate-binding protein
MPDLMEAGDVQWVPQWPGEQGSGMGIIQPYGLGITVPPEGASQDEWSRKQRAGIELIKLFLTKDFQRNLFENFGLFPVRDDVWGDFPDSSGSHRLYETATTMAESSDFAWAAHPQSVSVQYNVPAPHIQEALNGNKSPEQACDDIASDVREQLL